MDTKISADIWDDPDFMELSDSSKLAVFWIITKVNLLGYVEATPRKFARDLEAPFEAIEGACKGLARGLVKTERGVWCRNYIRRQFGCGQSLARSHMSKSIRKQAADVPDDVRLLIEEEYPEIFSFPSYDPKGLGSSLEATREGEGEGVREGEESDTTLKLDVALGVPADEHPVLIRLRELFRMRPGTVFDASTLRAFSKNKKGAAALMDSDWALLGWAYRQSEGDAAKFRRRDPATLLNNLLAEVLRARDWARAAGVNPAAVKPKQSVPVGWQDIITDADPSYNCTTWWDLPESLRAFVYERLAEGGKKIA